MIGAHMALRASAGQTGNMNRARVAGVAGSAIPDCPVCVGFPDAMALLATARYCRSALHLHKRMRRSAGPSWLIRFRKAYLVRSESFLTVHRRPCWCRMATAQELLIDVLMACTAISGRQFGRYDETLMIILLLS